MSTNEKVPTRVPDVNPLPLLLAMIWFITSAPVWIITIVNAKVWELSKTNLIILGSCSHLLGFICFASWHHSLNKPVRDFWKKYDIKRTFEIIEKNTTTP